MGDLQSSVAALTAFVVALTGLVPVVIKLWQKVSRQAREFEEFYAAHLLRGKIEALQKNLAVEFFPTTDVRPEDEFMPLALRKRVYEMYADITPALRALRAKYPDATGVEMAMMIERQFGGWLGKNVCLPLATNQFACLEMAISVADGIPPVPESTHD